MKVRPQACLASNQAAENSSMEKRHMRNDKMLLLWRFFRLTGIQGWNLMTLESILLRLSLSNITDLQEARGFIIENAKEQYWIEGDTPDPVVEHPEKFLGIESKGFKMVLRKLDEVFNLLQSWEQQCAAQATTLHAAEPLS